MTRTKHLTPSMIGRSQFPGRNHHPRDLARSCFRIIPLEAKSAQNGSNSGRAWLAPSREVRGRRPAATRHRSRTVARCSRRMEPAVRSARIKSTITTGRPRNDPLLASKTQKISGSRPALAVNTLPRGTEFLDAETGGQNRAERPQVSPETERAERYRRKSPQKRPVLSRPGNLQFGGTGWWRMQSSETGLQRRTGNFQGIPAQNRCPTCLWRLAARISIAIPISYISSNTAQRASNRARHWTSDTPAWRPPGDNM